jgi:hypothetical protein
MARRRAIRRRSVLGNEAANALLCGPDLKRRQMVEALAAADGGARAPAALRAEAGVDHRSPLAAPANQLLSTTIPLTATAPTELVSCAPR